MSGDLAHPGELAWFDSLADETGSVRLAAAAAAVAATDVRVGWYTDEDLFGVAPDGCEVDPHWTPWLHAMPDARRRELSQFVVLRLQVAFEHVDDFDDGTAMMCADYAILSQALAAGRSQVAWSVDGADDTTVRGTAVLLDDDLVLVDDHEPDGSHAVRFSNGERTRQHVADALAGARGGHVGVGPVWGPADRIAQVPAGSSAEGLVRLVAELWAAT